ASWNTNPIRGLPCGHDTVPALGAMSPAITRSAVDFPQPEGPTSDRNSPSVTSKSSGPSAFTLLAKTRSTWENAAITPTNLPFKVCKLTPILFAPHFSVKDNCANLPMSQGIRPSRWRLHAQGAGGAHVIQLCHQIPAQISRLRLHRGDDGLCRGPQ